MSEIRGGGATVTRVVPKGPSPFAGAPKRCTKTGCTGELEPSVDRNGNSISECAKCGTIYRPGIGATTSTSAAHGGPQCKVKGCPGPLDGSGACKCCEKRAAYLEKHLPKRYCEICSGEITQHGGRKHCEACKPIAQRVAVAKAKSKAA